MASGRGKDAHQKERGPTAVRTARQCRGGAEVGRCYGSFRGCDFQERTGLFEALAAAAIGQKTVVPDLDELGRQKMQP